MTNHILRKKKEVVPLINSKTQVVYVEVSEYLNVQMLYLDRGKPYLKKGKHLQKLLRVDPLKKNFSLYK